MEIKNYASAINAYRYNAESKPQAARKKPASSAANTDKAEFSAASRASFADAMKNAAKASAGQSASPERIAALKAAVADGSYNVSAEEVAASILGI